MTGTEVGSPWTFQVHPVASGVVGGLVVLYALATRRGRWAATLRQRVWFGSGLFVLLACLTWPLADLAARWSLLALVVQRLLLVVAVPALLALGLPLALVAAATRPAAVDATVRAVTRPPVAVAFVTVSVVATLTTGAVDAQVSSPLWRGLFDGMAVLTGFVLWAPHIAYLPAHRRPAPAGRAAYLVVQSIVPAFLSLVWIFARHPLYPGLVQAYRALGISPLLDQQLGGIVAKLGMIATLWSVAYVTLARGRRHPEVADTTRMTWADVERELQRSERRTRRPPGLSRPADGYGRSEGAGGG